MIIDLHLLAVALGYANKVNLIHRTCPEKPNTKVST
jgi:hypothetical protein